MSNLNQPIIDQIREQRAPGQIARARHIHQNMVRFYAYNARRRAAGLPPLNDEDHHDRLTGYSKVQKEFYEMRPDLRPVNLQNIFTR